MSQRRKIIYVHHVPRLGGSSISLSLLLKYLDRTKYEPVVVLTRDGPVRQAFEALGVRVEHVPMTHMSPYPRETLLAPEALTNYLSFLPNRQFRDFLLAEKPDLVHLNDVTMLAAGITACLCKIPIVWHVRGVIPKDWSPQRRVLRFLVPKLASRIVAVTEDEAIQFGSIGPKVAIVYNSVDFSVIERARVTGWKFRREIGCGEDCRIICAVISLHPAKGPWDFVRAASLTQTQCPNLNLRFVIAGHATRQARKLYRLRELTHFLGPRQPLDYVWELAREVGIQDKLILTGFRADVLSVIDAADIVVFPSRLGSVGRAAIEGSALGKPIVATVPQKVTGLVIDGETGLLAPPCNPRALADAFVKLLRHPSLAHRMGEAGRAYALQHFDARRNIEPIHQIYEQILSTDVARRDAVSYRGEHTT